LVVDAEAALGGYAACDARVDLTREAYLSHFRFGEDFGDLLRANGGSAAGYQGPCWAAWLHWDVDAGDLGRALEGARRLAAGLLERYRELDEEHLLLFLSGSKGFHVSAPAAAWGPAPSALFHKAARHFALAAAGRAGVAVDAGVYDKVRPFRAPNSRHPKTGLYKRRLSYAELMGLSLERIVELAREPAPFDVPSGVALCGQAAEDWAAAVAAAGRDAGAARRRAAAPGQARLNRLTLEIIRDGTTMAQGDRHRLLYSAARNLAEMGCPFHAVRELLTGPGLDSGLPPKEVLRQIECGVAAAVAAGAAA
jgi:hypothetical protein